jgi:hypothetical protein
MENENHSYFKKYFPFLKTKKPERALIFGGYKKFS